MANEDDDMLPIMDGDLGLVLPDILRPEALPQQALQALQDRRDRRPRPLQDLPSRPAASSAGGPAGGAYAPHGGALAPHDRSRSILRPAENLQEDAADDDVNQFYIVVVTKAQEQAINLVLGYAPRSHPHVHPVNIMGIWILQFATHLVIE